MEKKEKKVAGVGLKEEDDVEQLESHAVGKEQDASLEYSPPLEDTHSDKVEKVRKRKAWIISYCSGFSRGSFYIRIPPKRRRPPVMSSSSKKIPQVTMAIPTKRRYRLLTVLLMKTWTMTRRKNPTPSLVLDRLDKRNLNRAPFMLASTMV